jgi:hypothetical protein
MPAMRGRIFVTLLAIGAVVVAYSTRREPRANRVPHVHGQDRRADQVRRRLVTRPPAGARPGALDRPTAPGPACAGSSTACSRRIDTTSRKVTADQLVADLERHREDAERVRVYTIAYAAGDSPFASVLGRIAAAGGGRSYSGTTRNIESVDKSISSFF